MCTAPPFGDTGCMGDPGKPAAGQLLPAGRAPALMWCAMAQLSLGEAKWRMLRRVIRMKRFRYEDCRNMHRFDRDHFDWLVERGFVADAGGGWYEVTDKGKAAADLGFYEI